jgi:small subunit ribosomal protein S1
VDRLIEENDIDELQDSLDEGWWRAVLQDEEANADSLASLNCSPCKSAEPGLINWQCARKVYENDEVVLLRTVGFNRGGLLVEGEGLQGFVPISHLLGLPQNLAEANKQAFLEDYSGKSLYVKIIEFDPTAQRLVFSERAAQAGEGKRKELFQQLKPDTIICGVVTNITDFGLFVDLGGVEGLVHVSELSWGRVENPSALFTVGQQVKVTVLSINDGNSRIALSIKRLAPNPWDRLMSNYKLGDVIPATITTTTKFGVFARLQEGVEGLIHISSMPDLEDVHELGSVFRHGQEVKVKILHIDVDRRRLGLGLVEGI